MGYNVRGNLPGKNIQTRGKSVGSVDTLRKVYSAPVPANAPESLRYFDRVTKSPGLRTLIEEAKRDLKDKPGRAR